MKKYLLPQIGCFYKANLHCHTTVSDGSITPEEIKTFIREKGIPWLHILIMMC